MKKHISEQAAANDDKSKLIQSLRELMHEHESMNEAELARQTNIPKTTIYKILSGETTDPRSSTLTIIADYFEVTLDQLMGLAPHSFKSLNQIPSRSIPIISWEDAVRGSKHISTLTPNNWENWATIDTEIPNAYALVTRPAMRSKFPNGTMLVINPDLEPQDGDYIVVHYSDTKEATLREISIDGRTVNLRSFSEELEIEKLTDSIRILGVLVQSRFMHRGS